MHPACALYYDDLGWRQTHFQQPRQQQQRQRLLHPTFVRCHLSDANSTRAEVHRSSTEEEEVEEEEEMSATQPSTSPPSYGQAITQEEESPSGSASWATLAQSTGNQKTTTL